MMPFGLNRAAASFQRVMDKVLNGVQDCAIAYIDDILIHSSSWDAYMIHLQRVLDALQQAGLTVNLKKSKLGQQYLGFHIGHGRIWAGPDKMAALWDVPLPSTKKDLQHFLGLANYYRQFVTRFSARAGPLTDLLKGKGKGTRPVQWTQEAREAFHDVRNALGQNAVLYAPLPQHPFCLYTDASDRGLGAVLTQDTLVGQQPVFFLSCKLSKAENNYVVVEREVLAVQWAIDDFKYYLWRHKFTVVTDHALLPWLNRMKDANPCLIQ